MEIVALIHKPYLCFTKKVCLLRVHIEGSPDRVKLHSRNIKCADDLDKVRIACLTANPGDEILSYFPSDF